MNNDPKFTEKEFDEELRKLFEAKHLEAPSPQFKEDVMGKVRIEAKRQNYRPVISGMGWVIVSFFILAVVVFALLSPSSPASTPAWISDVTGFFSSGKLDVPFLGSVNKFLNAFHASGLLLPLTGLLFAMGFHGLVMKRFYFHGKKKISETYLF